MRCFKELQFSEEKRSGRNAAKLASAMLLEGLFTLPKLLCRAVVTFSSPAPTGAVNCHVKGCGFNPIRKGLPVLHAPRPSERRLLILHVCR